jgi:enoyl-CoA hydratase
MGARTMQRLAAELDARGHLAKGARAFGAAVLEKGIKEAVRMRDEPFGTSFARVDEPDVDE